MKMDGPKKGWDRFDWDFRSAIMVAAHAEQVAELFFKCLQIVPFVFAPQGRIKRENCSLYADSKDHQRQKGEARPDLVWAVVFHWHSPEVGVEESSPLVEGATAMHTLRRLWARRAGWMS